MRILVVGAGGHGQVVADAIKCMHAAGETIDVAGFLDDRTELLGAEFLGVPVLGPLASLSEFPHDGVVVALGNNRIRRQLFEQFVEAGEQLVTVIHPSAVIASDVRIGAGCMVIGGVVINTGTVVGDNTILNTGCTIDHHNAIGAHVHVAPGAHLGGEVCVDEGAMVGIGAAVLPRNRVGARATVGGGSTVICDIREGVTAVGSPARALDRS